MAHLKIGDNAPDFELMDQESKKTSMRDFKGKWIVLYFYPKDNTPGCTIEAIAFTQALKQFEKDGCVILGVSPDSVESQCKFIERQNLKIKLLSHPEREAYEKYGAWGEKNMYGKKYMGVIRSTFLIDPKGEIAYIWPRVSPRGHAEDVRDKLKELK